MDQNLYSGISNLNQIQTTIPAAWVILPDPEHILLHNCVVISNYPPLKETKLLDYPFPPISDIVKDSTRRYMVSFRVVKCNSEMHCLLRALMSWRPISPYPELSHLGS